MKLLDVNILVQVHRKDGDRHREIVKWLGSGMMEPPGVAVSGLVLSGFLRVLTLPKIYRDPSPLNVAMEFVDRLREHEAVSIVAPGASHWEIFRKLCGKVEARGNLVPDAYHAAPAIKTGCEWVTLDREFSSYPGLRWRHPLDE